MPTLTGNAAAQLTVTRAGDAYLQDGAGIWTLVPANTPRISSRGWLLFEEQRTNVVRNNACQGATPGSPGVMPTNWFSSPSPTIGLSRQVVGTGIEDGIEYCDIRWSGTSTGGNFIFAAPEATNWAATPTNMPWSYSYYLKRTAGTLTNVSYLSIRVVEMDTGGFTLRNNFDGPDLKDAILPQGLITRLSSGRVVYSRTSSNDVSVGFTSSGISMTCAAGPVDVTLRIGWPQQEQPFASSQPPQASTPIRTIGANATRAADVVSLPMANWFNPAEGTLYFELAHDYYGLAGGTNSWFSVGDGSTIVNRIIMYIGNHRPQGLVTVGSSNVVGLGQHYVVTYGDFEKVMFSYKLDDCLMSFDGNTQFQDLSGAMPSPSTMTTMRLADNAGLVRGCFRIRRIIYWPFRNIPMTTQREMTKAT